MKTLMTMLALLVAWQPSSSPGRVSAVAAAGTRAAAAGVTFSGTVAGSDQGFLKDASVVIDGPQHKEARTDADGRFTIGEVVRGRYQLHVIAEGYLPLDRPMDVGDASISVDIMLLRLPGL